MINLRKITEENFIDAFNLKEQPFQTSFEVPKQCRSFNPQHGFSCRIMEQT